jgi:hypothetical protein
MFRGQCHCRECQYFAGGGANLFMGIAEDAFSYTKGAPKTFQRTDLERPVAREFCGECGTHILTHAPGVPAAVVKVGTLDEPSRFDGPQFATYTIEKASYHHIPEGCRAFERMPG